MTARRLEMTEINKGFDLMWAKASEELSSTIVSGSFH
jgi:hypothetical protein